MSEVVIQWQEGIMTSFLPPSSSFLEAKIILLLKKKLCPCSSLLGNPHRFPAAHRGFRAFGWRSRPPRPGPFSTAFLSTKHLTSALYSTKHSISASLICPTNPQCEYYFPPHFPVRKPSLEKLPRVIAWKTGEAGL